MNYADNVRESTTATDATTVALAGAAQNYRSFAAAYSVGTTDIPVKIGPDSAGAWETGAYTLSAAGTLTRTSILSSSNANAAVAFAAGAKDVAVVYPASTAVDADNVRTLKNKRIQGRVLTINAPAAAPAINTDNFDRLTLTSVAVNITAITVTGTPVAGDSLAIDITDNGSSRTYSLGTSFESSSISPPAVTVAGQKVSLFFDWNPATSKWRCVGVA